MTSEEFNDIYSVGTSVNYHPIIGRSEHIKTITRSEAWTLPNGQAVVKVKGNAGCVSLEAISIAPSVERYVQLGRKTEDHKLDCMCEDCQEFLKQGDLVHEMGLQA
jgi:hypothetical protein